MPFVSTIVAAPSSGNSRSAVETPGMPPPWATQRRPRTRDTNHAIPQPSSPGPLRPVTTCIRRTESSLSTRTPSSVPPARCIRANRARSFTLEQTADAPGWSKS
ncbi:MAG TPA: hypothetical protein VML55_04715 [Planctomycetaceae bacterium]|nr:hypothetical protein [Planctomycetaceae bacterium]